MSPGANKIRGSEEVGDYWFYGIQPGVFHFLSNVNIQAKSHFANFSSSVVSS